MGIESAASASRAAVDELLVTAEQAEANWTTPRATGKWSLQQVSEHVAKIFN